MFHKLRYDHILNPLKKIDWKLLIFLLIFLNVKLIIKLAAIIILYLLRFNFKWGFKLHHSRLPLFYPAILSIALLNLFISPSIHFNYILSFSIGMGCWLVCILAIHQVTLSIEASEPEVIHRTITVFFAINVMFSLAAFWIIEMKTGTINPYLYQGAYQTYFIGTGDYIRGISFDTSTTNAVLNAIGVIYFLYRRNSLMVLSCMGILLLTGSNIITLISGSILLFIFVFKSNRDQKSMVLLCFLLLVVFFSRVSPQNLDYLSGQVSKLSGYRTGAGTPGPHYPLTKKQDRNPDTEKQKQQFARKYIDSLHRVLSQKNTRPHRASGIPLPVIPEPDLNQPAFQHRSVITTAELKMRQFVADHSLQLPMSSNPEITTNQPGKMIAAIQTFEYLATNPYKLLTGTGTGNFSSKLAFRTTGLGIAGGYPADYSYTNAAFVSNHLDVYLHFFTKEDSAHSIANTPASVYDQLLSEYGLAGILAFGIFYIGFFGKRLHQFSYALPLLLLLTAVLFIDYWFEQLSVIIVFELLLMLQIKEEAKTT